MAGTGVEVKGLRELARELGRVSPRLRTELGREYRRIGSVLAGRAESRIATAAKGRGGSHGGQRYKPSVATTAAKITVGGNVRALGDEFGAKRYRQFSGFRGNQWGDWPDGGIGYGLLPVIRDAETEIKDWFYDAVENALKGAYPDRA